MITTTSGTRLAAAILLMAACADPDDLLVPSGGASPLATRVRAVTGDAQTGVVDRTLPSPLTVEVRDQDDLPMAGVAVTWSVEPAGEFVALDHFTGADGLASALLKMGGQAGDYEAALDASAGRVVFSATATADQPAQAEPVAGDGQTGVVGSSTPNPVVVLVRDQFGNPAPGAVVTWNSSDLGQAVPAQTMTDAEGLTTTDWILGCTPGPQTLSASAGAAWVEFDGTAETGAAAQVTKVSGDQQDGLFGAELDEEIAVRVEDACGNPVAGITVNFEITSNKGGEADPVTVTTDDAGEARTVWRLGFGIGTHSLSAWADVDGTQLSASFTATAVN